MSHLFALDQGTSITRSILFNRQGVIVGLAQRERTQHYPQPGWVEHDPMEIWDTQRSTMIDALAQASIGAEAITAIGITNQRETAIVWDRKTGRPIHKAIVWQDRRAEPACAALRENGFESLIRQRTGLRLDAYFSATKLQWILEHVRSEERRVGKKGV